MSGRSLWNVHRHKWLRLAPQSPIGPLEPISSTSSDDSFGSGDSDDMEWDDDPIATEIVSIISMYREPYPPFSRPLPLSRVVNVAFKVWKLEGDD
jgi:hypothetical protein